MPDELAARYTRLKKAAAAGIGGQATACAISEMVLHARTLLYTLRRVEFVSAVANKRYFGYRGEQESRPINAAIWLDGDFLADLANLRNGFHGCPPARITRVTYTAAYSVFAAHDAYGVGRKASATFFEILIGHIVAAAIGIEPRQTVKMPETGTALPTDFVFDPGGDGRKMHLPIKTSTRERAVQAWVHQLILDKIFGDGIYRGIFVVAAETKRNARTGGITEICVPRQLQLYQSRLARLTRIYYLDPPAVYLALAAGAEHQRLPVRPFGECIGELAGLL